MTRLLYPQEIDVFYIIPSLKRNLAMCMKLNGLNQSRIAELLQIDKATVSQYISKKRGSTVEFDEDIIKEVGRSAKLIHDKISLLNEVQRLLSFTKKNKMLCKIHKQITGELPCTPELEKYCLEGM